MISWIIRLCVLCSMSALAQMVVDQESAHDALKMICGLLMLHMTLKSADTLLSELALSTSLTEVFTLLLK